MDPLSRENDAPNGGRPRLRDRLRGWRKFYLETIWLADLSALPRPRAVLYRVARVLSLAGRGYFHDECPFRASALTYTTVLSLVPVLAFAFSMAKGLGFYESLRKNTIEEFLDSTFGEKTADAATEKPEPGSAAATSAETSPTATGEKKKEEGPTNVRGVIEKILDFVKDTNVGALGTLGALILVYTIIQLLGTIERSFNDIWGVARQRSLVRKIADYLTLVVITPIFLFTATSLTAAAQSNAFVAFLSEDLKLEAVINLILRFTPLFSMWIGFTFLYLVMPNTKTRFSSALLGGIVGGTLWQLAQVGHVKFQIGVAKYSALYSTFAAFPIFLVWLYLSWAIVLAGAELAAAHQNEHLHARTVRAKTPEQLLKENIALRAVTKIAEAFGAGKAHWTASGLARRLGFPEPTVENVLGRLVFAKILAPVGDERDPGYLPARDVGSITVKNVLDALRGTGGEITFPPDERRDERVERILAGIDRAIAESDCNLSLLEIARGEGVCAAGRREKS